MPKRNPIVEDVLRLEKLGFPPDPPVTDLRWYEYIDSIGDPALDITVVVDPPEGDENFDVKKLRPIRDRIFEVLRQAEVEEFPYISFITRTELAAESAATR